MSDLFTGVWDVVPGKRCKKRPLTEKDRKILWDAVNAMWEKQECQKKLQ